MLTIIRILKLLTASLVCLLVLFPFVAPHPGIAQTGGLYDLTWNTSYGGGQSSGGLYTLAGTIGQPDAGQSSGGAYILGGGFWGGGVVSSIPNQAMYLPVVLK